MIADILRKINIASLNEMQKASISAVKQQDLVLLSPTGSGKTLAFLIPVLNRLQPDNPNIQALILVPSRELAQQIEQVWRQMGTGYKVTCFYGGHATKSERNSLLQPPALLIGTPGRIAYHLRNKNFDPYPIHTLVLDEFDKSLEFGFQEEMSFIIDHLKNIDKRMLTSATALETIPGFTGLKANVATLDFLTTEEHIPHLSIKAVSTLAADKAETLFSLLCFIRDQPTLVFCNHREAVMRISDLLYDHQIAHGIFHGGMEQEDREKALLQFKNGSHRFLICTDLAARGLDIPSIHCIVHYQLPTAETFIHRNGRTARMQADGTVYLILNEGEYPTYLSEKPEMISLPEQLTLPPPSPWCTLYIAAGKKSKVNKIDIVGLLLKKGGLKKEDLGLIHVFDNASYVAVKKKVAKQLLTLISAEKIKNKKVKIGYLSKR